MRLRPVPLALVLCGPLVSFVLAACAPSSPESAAPRLRLHELTSGIYGNERLIRVWVPRGYDDPAEAETDYPVLYLNDGQNVFDSATALFGDAEWRADETVDSLVAAERIPPVIVVGIDNAGRSGRAHEYLPYPDEYLDPPDPDPRGDRYAAFLRDEVFPLVDELYRTKPDERTLSGSSYGALAMLYVAATAPDLARSLLLESPSLYVDGGAIFDDVQRADLALRRVYVGIGTNELGAPECELTPDNVAAVNDVRRLERMLDMKGHGSLWTRVAVEDCATHGEAAWARRLPAALEFLLRP
jgi:predicted alpha/beta superfamily hydrolase